MDLGEGVELCRFRIVDLQTFCRPLGDKLFLGKLFDRVVDSFGVVIGSVSVDWSGEFSVLELAVCLGDVGADVLDDDRAPFVSFAYDYVVSFK